MKIEKVPIKDLFSPNYNPRQISDTEMEKLKQSIKEFGYVDPIIVNSYNNHIIGGNQRFEAMKQLGYDEIDVSFVNITDPNREKALNLRLNKLSGEWNTEKLNDIIEELQINHFDLSITGFDDFDKEIDFEMLMEMESISNDLNEESTVESTRESTVESTEDVELIQDDYKKEDFEVNVKSGDLFRLGRHFLLCGDATNKNDLEKLLSKNNSSEPVLIDCFITDPPYGVDYSAKNEMLNKLDGGNRMEREIVNDSIQDYESFFTIILKNVKTFLNDYNLFYIFMSGKELHNLRISIDNAGFYCSDYLIWVKNNHVLGRKDYKAKHEFCVYGWYNHHKFYGGFQTTVLEFNRPSQSKIHPTMKPLDLVGKLIQDGTLENMNVLDTFGGSGTTLIACEELGRNCFMMELEPYYCQMIINRWEELTGEKAEKI